jgi:hypothetical protein
MMTSELEWDPSVDQEFKEDEQWGDTPSIPSSFDDVGDYKNRVALQHQSYFQRQDGDSIDDIINQWSLPLTQYLLFMSLMLLSFMTYMIQKF